MISEDASVRDMQAEKLNAILRLDSEVYNRLYDLSDGKISALKTEEVYGKLIQSRILDVPPTSLKLNTKGGLPSGCFEMFKFVYNDIQVGDDDITGSIQIAGATLVCDISVLKTLKALLKVGTCRNEDLASACRNVVYSIIKVGATGSVITKDRMLEVLNFKEYYAERLSAAIKEVQHVQE